MSVDKLLRQLFRDPKISSFPKKVSVTKRDTGTLYLESRDVTLDRLEKFIFLQMLYFVLLS